MARYAGSCHCGAVRFEIEAEATEMTTCDCTLCVKKNALMVRVPEQSLTITSDAASLATYQWNTHVARHHFCTRCGIYTFHRKRADPTSFGVNVFCLEGFDRSRLPTRPTDGIGMSIVDP
jgi:hypothetical protein